MLIKHVWFTSFINLHFFMEISVTKHSFEITINVRQWCLKCGFLNEFKPINSNSDSFKCFLVLDTPGRAKCLV